MSENKKYILADDKSNIMKEHLIVDQEKIDKMLDIKLKVFNKDITPPEARKLVNNTFKTVSAEEFAYGEQHLYNAGITDEIMAEGMDDLLDVFKDVLVVNKLNLPKGHPIHTFADEAIALKTLLIEMELKLNRKFIKNQWQELYEKLSKINVHFSRKQHQLFPALERKGFDRPSKIMWTFDDRVRDAIKEAYEFLKADKDEAFLNAQPNVFYLVRDILQKENDVLYPTSLKLLSEDEFVEMRKSDDEIGYCLIENPPLFTGLPQKENIKVNVETKNLINDLKEVLEKYGLSGSVAKDQELDVSIGKMTLEQINLVYKHMKVDLSYVDENDIVKFYTDTKHRVFPRSAGVIGRMVQNCHPRDSVASVMAIIEAFRSGTQNEAEFWLDRGDKFIYIVYNAVHDDEGNFKGVLEMMQDVTHIRSLTGSQRLLSWNNNDSGKEEKRASEAKPDNRYEIAPEMTIGRLLEQYPFLKEFLISLSPNFDQLNNPAVFGVMKNVASLGTISQVGGFEVNNLIQLITNAIDKNKGSVPE
jgi:DUF438 domain-containing protein